MTRDRTRVRFSCPFQRITDMDVIRRWSSEELVRRYGETYGIDIAAFIESDQITLCRDSFTGILRFDGVAPGDGDFYASLTDHQSYYLQDKWEYRQARDAIVLHNLKTHRDRDRNGYGDDQRERTGPKGPTSILDIGCGDGGFLRSCRRDGLGQLEGIEMNPRAIQRCQSDDLLVSARDVATRLKQGDRFDVVTAFQVLEHVAEPLEFIQEIWDILNPGGIAIFAVPNADSFMKRFNWNLLDMPPHHMTRWDAVAFRTVASQIGFDVRQIAVEPLSRVHHRFYASSCVQQWSRRSLRRKAVRRLIRLGVKFPGVSQRIAGHSILVEFQKPLPNVQSAPASEAGYTVCRW